MNLEEIREVTKEAELYLDGVNQSMPLYVMKLKDLQRFAAIIEKSTIARCAEYVNEVCTYGDTHLLVKAIRKLGEQE